MGQREPTALGSAVRNESPSIESTSFEMQIIAASESNTRVDANKSASRDVSYGADNTRDYLFCYWEDKSGLAAIGCDLSVLKYKKIGSVFVFVSNSKTHEYLYRKLLYDSVTYTQEMGFDLNFKVKEASEERIGRQSVYESTNISSLFKSYPREQLQYFGVKIKARYTRSDTPMSIGDGFWINSTRSAYPPYFIVVYNDLPPLPPTTLNPDKGVLMNPKGSVTLSWEHLPNNFEGDDYQGMPLTDTQNASRLRYNVNGGAWTELAINDNMNAYTFPANRFANGNTVNWQVRTGTVHNGFGEWSETATFKLGPTPPEKPLPIYPTGIVVNGDGGIDFEWRYVSNFDILPSRFDIAFRIDDGVWTEKLHATTGDKIYRIPGVSTSSKIDWCVKGYGQYGDAGEWSDIATFHTVGRPAAPSIVQITNTGRPVIYWSAVGMVVYEIEIRSGTETIFASGTNPYTDTSTYKLPVFLNDGQYIARLRVKNEYNFYSEWVERAFTVNTVKPVAPKLQVISNPERCMRLYFTKTAECMLVYRKESSASRYACIAIVTDADFYDDFTAVPDVEYMYFIRAVDGMDSFVDSNGVSGELHFSETAMASTADLSAILPLSVELGGTPQKNMTVGKEYRFTYYLGREYPVAEVDEFSGKMMSFSFFVPLRDYERLERYACSFEPLLIRDSRVGATYGFIDGKLRVENTDFKGYAVSFSFTKIAYPEEVVLDS